MLGNFESDSYYYESVKQWVFLSVEVSAFIYTFRVKSYEIDVLLIREGKCSRWNYFLYVTATWQNSTKQSFG